MYRPNITIYIYVYIYVCVCVCSHLGSELSGTINGTSYTIDTWPSVVARPPVTGPSIPSTGYVMLSDMGPGMGPIWGWEIICRSRTMPSPGRRQSSNMYNPMRVPGSKLQFLLIFSTAYLDINSSHYNTMPYIDDNVWVRAAHCLCSHERVILDVISWVSKHGGK